MMVNEIVSQMENVQIKMWTLNSLTLAVHDAIVEGPNDSRNFHGALHALTCMTYEIEKEVNSLTKEIFKIKSAEKGNEEEF